MSISTSSGDIASFFTNQWWSRHIQGQFFMDHYPKPLPPMTAWWNLQKLKVKQFYSFGILLVFCVCMYTYTYLNVYIVYIYASFKLFLNMFYDLGREN